MRTELGRAFSAAAQERMEAASKIVPGLKKQWRRSGKLHPRIHHDLADGRSAFATYSAVALKGWGRDEPVISAVQRSDGGWMPRHSIRRAP